MSFDGHTTNVFVHRWLQKVSVGLPGIIIISIELFHKITLTARLWYCQFIGNITF